MNKIARVALLIPVGVLALLAQGPPMGEFGGGPGFGPRGGMGRGHHEQLVAGAPYSGTLVEQHQRTLPDGSQKSIQSETKIYRDSEGRVRREMTRTGRNGETQTFISIFDPVGGFEARLNPEKLTAEKHTLPTPKENADAPPPPPAGEHGPKVSTEDLGSKTIEGLVAVGKRVTMTIPAGEMDNDEPVQTVREVWTSTVLKAPVLVTVTNPRFGNSTSQLTAVSQSEPDAALFQVPANYKIVTAAGHHGGPSREE